MTYEQYIQEIRKERPSSLRYGQWLFNTLYRVNSELAEKINGTQYDCYHAIDEDRIALFLGYVFLHWTEQSD